MSISPDTENILPVIEWLKERDVAVFLTHTRASVEETEAAIEAGARHATHFYDVFYPPAEQDPGVRPVGAVEAVLADPRTTVDFIADGIHVHPTAIRAALAARGVESVSLITDSNVGAGLPPDVYDTPNGFRVRIEEGGAPRHETMGVLAGSALTMNRGMENLLGWIDLPPEQVWAMGNRQSGPGGRTSGSRHPGSRNPRRPGPLGRRPQPGPNLGRRAPDFAVRADPIAVTGFMLRSSHFFCAVEVAVSCLPSLPAVASCEGGPDPAEREKEGRSLWRRRELGPPNLPPLGLIPLSAIGRRGCPSFPRPAPERLDLPMPETVHRVVIDHPYRLHECVADGRSDELEPEALEFLAHGIRRGRVDRNIRHLFPSILNGNAIDEFPEQTGKRLTGIPEIEGGSGVDARRGHFEAIADDARILQEFLLFCLRPTHDLFGIESAVCFSIAFPVFEES